MLIGLVSDSHGNTHAIDRMLAHPAGRGVKLWLHTGDIVPDAEYLAMASEIGVESVAGNCDYFNSTTPLERVVEVAGHRLFMAHGHTLGVRGGIGAISKAALAAGADIAVYGHTHIALMERSSDGIYVYNAGSVAQPRDHEYGSFMVIDLEAGKVPRAELIRFSEN